MKFNQFTKIIGRIQHDIPCPKCKSLFKSEAIEVVDLHDNKIRLAADCPNCAEKVMISASLEKPSVNSVPRIIRKKEEALKRVLSPRDISKISEGIKGFKGEDVRELFDKK